MRAFGLVKGSSGIRSAHDISEQMRGAKLLKFAQREKSVRTARRCRREQSVFQTLSHLRFRRSSSHESRFQWTTTSFRAISAKRVNDATRGPTRANLSGSSDVRAEGCTGRSGSVRYIAILKGRARSAEIVASANKYVRRDITISIVRPLE